jgi:hypothetical protein
MPNIERTRSAIKENAKKELVLECTVEFTDEMEDEFDEIYAGKTEPQWKTNINATVAAFQYLREQAAKIPDR